MTQEQKDRALACIRGAEDLGARYFFVVDNPCCAVGYLLSCAGVKANDYYRERTNRQFALITYRHPELYEQYGLLEYHVMGITEANDTRDHSEDRREAVLALIESWEVEDAPA